MADPVTTDPLAWLKSSLTLFQEGATVFGQPFDPNPLHSPYVQGALAPSAPGGGALAVEPGVSEPMPWNTIMLVGGAALLAYFMLNKRK